MDNKKITIVTAFFPLNRGEWKGFERKDNKYIEYFKFWARIKNDLIIFTTSEYKNELNNIRKEFGRENTEVIVIDDWKNIDEELYMSIKETSKNKESNNFRLQNKNPECWNYDYNFVMILKEYCCYRAAKEKKYTKEQIAWVDFGFNHGGDYYTNPEEFDFEWRYNFSDKIHLFLVEELDELPIYEIVRRMNTYIQGDVIVANGELWEKLWYMVRENMMALNKCGLMDDDQTLLLMAYREENKIFELHESKWFSTIDDFSEQKFTVKLQKNNFINILKKKIKYKMFVIQNLRREYNSLIRQKVIKG